MHLSTSGGVRCGLPLYAVAQRLDLTERSRVCIRCVRLQFDIKPLGPIQIKHFPAATVYDLIQILRTP